MNVNAKHLQRQSIVSERSCGPSLYIFDIISVFSADHSLKNWLRKLNNNRFTCVFNGFEI